MPLLLTFFHSTLLSTFFWGNDFFQIKTLQKNGWKMKPTRFLNFLSVFQVPKTTKLIFHQILPCFSVFFLRQLSPFLFSRSFLSVRKKGSSNPEICAQANFAFFPKSKVVLIFKSQRNGPEKVVSRWKVFWGLFFVIHQSDLFCQSTKLHFPDM